MKIPTIKLRVIALLIVLSSALILGAAQYIVHFTFFNNVVDKFENETFEVMEQNLESMLEYPIATGNRKVINDLASKLVSLDFVYSIEIRNENDEVLAYKIDESIPISEGIPIVTKKIDFYRSYISGFGGVDDDQVTREVMGSARIAMTHYQAQLFFSKNLRNHALISAGVLLLIVFMILLFVGYFERQSKRVIDLLNRIAKQDYSKIESSSQVVEINEITTGLDALASTLQTQFNSLERASSYKTMMLEVMSHELNQPLNTLKPLLELVEKQSSELNPLVRNQVSICLSATDQLCRIVDRVAHFSRLDANESIKRITLMNPESLFDDIHAIYQAQNHKQLNFEVNAKVTRTTIGNTAIYTDETMLTQIVSNLLSNAFKFTQRGFVRLEWSVEQQDASYFLTFEVCDSGIGIEDENLNQVFNDYFREDTNAAGLGIGLSLVRAFVSELGGSIDLKSKRGFGTCISVSIPVSITKPESNPEQVLAGSALNCLVVDDNQNNAFAIDALLASYGLQSQYVTCPLEAIDLTKHNNFDLIIADFSMPGMTGIELAEKLSSTGIPIVIVTAHHNRELVRKFDSLIAKRVIFRYIPKPLSHANLEALMKDLLRSERVTRSLLDIFNRDNL